ncbi:MAG: DUF4760 domain-containing protein [Amphritea sp.]|nr:DUF4760 domain-containing protein [Amphritea sp.]
MPENSTAADAVVKTQEIAREACSQASLLSGETLGFWIQTTAIILTALFAAWAVISARQMTRKKNAADVIFHSKSDTSLRTGIKTIMRLNSDKDVDISKYAYDSDEERHAAEAGSIRYVLNYYEYIAVGIKRGIYDEKILKDSSYSTMTSMYEFCEPYIQSVRRVNARNTTWCEFERLAKKWLNNPIKNSRK